MGWAKIDDAFYRHPKARAAGKDGRALFIAGLCWAGAHLTDGYIAGSDLGLIAAEAEVRPKPTMSCLVAVGLWHPVDGGWQIHDYHDFNPSAAAEREKRRKRAEAGRKGGLKSKPPNSKPEADSQPNEEPTGKRIRTPSPSLTDENTSSSELTTDANPPDDDHQQPPPIVCQAVAILAARDLAARQAAPNQPPVGDPTSWENAAYDRRLAVAWPLANLAEQHPAWTAQELADFAEPPPAAISTNGSRNPKASAYDAQQAAAHALAERHLRVISGEACDICNDTGWTLDDTGTAVPCEHDGAPT